MSGSEVSCPSAIYNFANMRRSLGLTLVINTIPYHTIPYRTIPYHTVTYRTIPYHTIPYRTIPYHTIPYPTYHAIPYYTLPYRTVPYHTIPYRTVPYHTIPYRTIPYHTIPYCTVPYHTIPYLPVTRHVINVTDFPLSLFLPSEYSPQNRLFFSANVRLDFHPPPNNQAKPVIRWPISANPGLNYNPDFISFYSKVSFFF